MDDRAKALAYILRRNAHQSGICVCGQKVKALTFTPTVKSYVITHRPDCPVVLANMTGQINPYPHPHQDE